MIAAKTLNLIPRMKMRGCWCLFDFNKFLKRGLEVVKTTLWAPVCSPSSQAKVTSVNSLSFLSSLKPDNVFSWKSFHFKQSFSELIILANLALKTRNRLMVTTEWGDESESGKIVLKQVKLAYFDAYLWQTMWNHTKKNQWKNSNFQIQCFYKGTSGALCWKRRKT